MLFINIAVAAMIAVHAQDILHSANHPEELIEPYRLTSHPAEDYMPAVSPNGRLLAFVSNRTGAPNIWIKSLKGGSLPTPRRLTSRTSKEKSPAFSPDGRHIVYVSYDSDAEGDLYRVSLPETKDFSGIEAEPERLTDITTADKEPVYSPDGESIIFTSADKQGGMENLYRLNVKTLQKFQLTSGGAQSPAISTDGSKVAFVSRRGGVKGALYLFDLASGDLSQLTFGQAIDSFPAFADDKNLVFVRYADDTNLDGSVTIEDRPALYRLDIEKPDKPPTQITTTESYNLFPRARDGYVYYAAKRGRSVDLYRIPVEGMFHPLSSLKEEMERATWVERYFPDRPQLSLMAWRLAQTAHYGDPDRARLAECVLNQGRILQKEKSLDFARAAYGRLIREFSSQHIQAGSAKIGQTLINSKLSNYPPRRLIAMLEQIEKEYETTPQVAARARIEIGAAYNKQGDPVEALKYFRSVVSRFSGLKELAAEAAFRRNEVYAMLADPEKRFQTYLGVIRSYPGQTKWRNKAVERMLDISIVKGDFRASLVNLDRVVESYDQFPFLQAAAISRIATLYYEKNELVKARKAYARVAARFAGLDDVKNQALFSVASIYSEQEEYAKALGVYKSIEQDTNLKREVFIHVKRARIDQSLRKARYELRNNEPRLALKTYRRLIEYDNTITEGHRGLIAGSAALGEVGKVIGEYEQKVAQNQDKAVWLYSLGLALTYKDLPLDFSRPEKLIRKAISIDDQNPWYHQTLGWLYERMEGQKPGHGFQERALQEYQYAMALLGPDASMQRKADLNLNLGNVNYYLKNYLDAKNYYKHRAESGVEFATKRVESLFNQRRAESEYKLGDDKAAILFFTKALKLAQEENIPGRVEILERRGLAHQSARQWGKAVVSFSKALKLRRQSGYEPDNPIALRNIANNLFFLTQSGENVDRAKLREALGFYHESERAIGVTKEKKKKKSGASLISVEIETGVGGVKGAYRGFNPAEERKLIFHHIGRIYGELKDYEKAVAYFEKKLDMTPSKLPLVDNVPVLTEKAIILNQIGYYLAKLDRPLDAITRFEESLDICLALNNHAGLLINADNMIKLTLAIVPAAGLGGLDRIIGKSAPAVDEVLKSPHSDNEMIGSVSSHLGQLYHRRLLMRSVAYETPELKKADVKTLAQALKSIGSDAFDSGRYYKTAVNRFGSVKTMSSARGLIVSYINLALLKADEGDVKEALSFLTKAVSKADRLAIPDLAWQALYLAYNLDPVTKETSLASIATAFEKTPFGYGYRENTGLVFAMIRSVYHDTAMRALDSGDISGAFNAIEKGLNAQVKLGLAGLMEMKEKGSNVPGLNGLVDLYRRRMMITELLIGREETGPESRDKSALTLWEKEYVSYIENLRGINPLLGQVAEPENFDPEVAMASLAEGEAAVALSRSDAGVVAFIVTPSDYRAMTLKPGEKLILSGEIKRLFLVTDRPFSDPLAIELSETAAVSAIPSFGYLYHYKQSRNINDFRLLAFGYDGSLSKELSEAFDESVFVSGRQAEELVNMGALKNAQVTAFFASPRPDPSAPLLTTFPLGSGAPESVGITPAWIAMEDLLSHEVDSAFLATPPFKVSKNRNWEPALQTLALLAGYSSWVILPVSREKQDAFLKTLAGRARNDSLADRFFAASETLNVKNSSRLLGAFGFSGAEREAYARRHFANHIRKGIEALRRKEYTAASDQLTKALRYTSSAGIEKYDARILDRLAEAEFKLNRFAPALKYQEKLNAIHRKSDNKKLLADSLKLTGVMQARLGRYEAAVESLTQALNLYRNLGLKAEMAAAYSGIGIAEENFNRYNRAIEAYSTAFDIKTVQNDRVSAALELGRIGRIYHIRLNRFDKARKVYQQALHALEKEGDERGAVKIMIALGAMEIDAGNLSKAEKIFIKVLSRASMAKDEKSVALAKFHLANIHWFRGEYQPALKLIRTSIKQSEVSGDLLGQAMAFNTLGLIYWTLNDYPRALEFLAQSLELAGKAGSKLDEASALNNIGLVYRRKGDLNRSLGYFERALAVDEKLKSDWGIAYDYRNMSVSLLRMGSVDDALQMALRAVELTKKIGDQVNYSKSLLQHAEIMAVQKQWTEAMDRFLKAELAARKVGGQETIWRALRGVGRSKAAVGDGPGAIETYKKAVDIVEKMRAGLKIDELKSGFLDDKQDLYEELILLLLDRGQVDEAFIYAERAKSRSFIDLLGASKIRLHDKISQDEYEKVKSLKSRLAELSKEGALTQKERIKIAGKLTTALDVIRLNNPGLVPFVSVKPIDLDRLKALLEDGVVLVEYVVAKNEVVAFIIDNEKAQVVRTKLDRSRLSAMVKGFRKLIQDGAPLEAESRELNKALIEPVFGKLKDAEIVGVIPHRDLHYLSFASLRDDEGYLIDKKPIFYLPAASVFEFTAKRRTSAPKQEMKALAVGNPDLGDLNTDLPLAELEAKSIKWSLPFVDILLGGSATETKVLEGIGQYDVLHIASHGQFDPVNPLLSALQFSGDTLNDGSLTAKEVFSLSLNADIVIMSACQTGLGKVTSGDEIVGLNRAFIYSGAHSIVSTLWRVDDLASALLMKHFYRNFVTTGKADALREAQLTIKRRFPHPSFWAGFTLVGDYK